jgi:hypothetical protein
MVKLEINMRIWLRLPLSCWPIYLNVFIENKIDKKDTYHSEDNYFPSPDIETSNIEKSGTNKAQLSPNISIKGQYHGMSAGCINVHVSAKNACVTASQTFSQTSKKVRHKKKFILDMQLYLK